jgi:hypothetical protein
MLMIDKKLRDVMLRILVIEIRVVVYFCSLRYETVWSGTTMLID